MSSRRMAVVTMALVLVAVCAQGGGSAGAAAPSAESFARRWLTSHAESLDADRIRSAEMRFVWTRTTPGRTLRLQYFVRRQGKQWHDVGETPLPPETVAHLMAGKGIPNEGRAGTPGRVQWGDPTTTYIAMANSFMGTLIRPSRKAPELPDEGQMSTLLQDIGYYSRMPNLATKRVGLGQTPHTFHLHHAGGKAVTTYRSTAEWSPQGLPETLELHIGGGLVQRQRFFGWRQCGGVWLPQRMVKECFYDPTVLMGRRGMERKALMEAHTTYTWEILDARINVPLKPSEVTREIPEKTLVFDERFGLRMQYRYRSDMTEAELLAIAEKTRREQQLKGGAASR